MDMRGWIKIFRDLLDHWLSSDMEKLGRWVWLLMTATHDDQKILVGNQLVELKRGQLIASNSTLAKAWNTSERSVLRYLDVLEKDNMLHRCTHRKVTIITICNFESYQDKRTSKRTDTRTDSALIAHRCRTTIQEEKERKEILDINTNAHTREEKVSFDAQREQGFFNTFKGTGVGVSVARATGKKADEIFLLLDIFMAECQIRESGHKDFQDFKEHFLNAIKGDYISLPVQPQPSQPKNKVITNEDLYKEMYG